MLALEPKLNEEIIFQNSDFQIRLKFYLNEDNHLRIAITAPRSISVFRKKIKKPVKMKNLYGFHLSSEQKS